MSNNVYVYVIHGEGNVCSVGTSTDPNSCRDTLQRDRSYTLEFALLRNVCGTEDDAKEIVRVARASASLRSLVIQGEWFNCPKDVAIDAINSAAKIRNI